MIRSVRIVRIGWVSVFCVLLLAPGVFTTRVLGVSWEPSVELCSQYQSSWCDLEALQWRIDAAPLPYVIYSSMAHAEAAFRAGYAEYGACLINSGYTDPLNAAWGMGCNDWQKKKNIWYCDNGNRAYAQCFIFWRRSSTDIMVQVPDTPITTEVTDKNAGVGCAGTCDTTAGGEGGR